MTSAIYLAGPEVFLPPAIRQDILRQKKAILNSLGMQALSPCDNDAEVTLDAEGASAIYLGNIRMMESAAGALVNLTPFRGPSADSGTVFELGFLVARHVPAVGYSSCRQSYPQRVPSSEMGIDLNGAAIEPFGLADNLMLICGLETNQHCGLVLGNRTMPEKGFAPEHYFDPDLFREAALLLQQRINRRTPHSKS